MQAYQTQQRSAEVLFKEFGSLKALVIGDLMLDRYLWGKVSRISPEAPVPVVDVFNDENRLGGAANVAMNLQSLGMEVSLFGLIGNDREGEQFRTVMDSLKLDQGGLMSLDERRTTTKIRVIGNNQQMLRVDKEQTEMLNASLEQRVRQHLDRVLASHQFNVIVFEDYDKGLLGPGIIRQGIAHARKHNIPVMVDPKFRNFFEYTHSTIFKPNLKELNQALGLQIEKQNLEGIRDGIKQLRKRMAHHATLVTLSENGMMLVDHKGDLYHLPAYYRQIVDVSGAGDTVVSVLAACVAADLDLLNATRMANLAGGLVCEHVGVVPIDPMRLEEEARKQGILG